MAKGRLIGPSNSLTGIETHSDSGFGETTFIHLLKRLFIWAVSIAILGSALVVPSFRDPIVTAVKNWLQAM